MNSYELPQRKANPKEKANIFSTLTFAYTIQTFLKGLKQEIDEDDLFQTLSEQKSELLGDKLEAVWREQIKKSNTSLKIALLKVFGKEFLFYGIIVLIFEVIPSIAQPIALGKLISYYAPNQTNMSINEAWLYACIVILCSIINAFAFHYQMISLSVLGMKMRVACCSLVYRKALRLNKVALQKANVGKIINLLSNDAIRFEVGTSFGHNLWVGPLQTIVISYLLYNEVEFFAFPGVAFLLLFIPVQIYFSRKASKLRFKTALCTDERVRLMNEIVTGIQVIKMYVWEKPFSDLIATARRLEVNKIRSLAYVKGIVLSFGMFSTRVAIFIIVIMYLTLGNKISATQVYVITAFFNILRLSMSMYFAQGAIKVQELFVTINRLNEFLLYEEKKEEEVTKEKKILLLQSQYIQPKIEIVDATVELSERILSDINLKLQRGQSIAVTGPVGSGKTSLLNLILQEFPLKSGDVTVRGSVSYSSQKPWIFSGTIKQNVIFGQPFNEELYRKVIEVCALSRDIGSFSKGDQTFIGDRGATLSGGQRARINLARSVYKNADIYLLDDPLSSVDAHVAKQIFTGCIRNFLKNKIVILVTHQLQFLEHFNNIVVLKSGRIESQGTYRELHFDFVSPIEDNVEENAEEKIEAEQGVKAQEGKGTGRSGSSLLMIYFRAAGIFFIFLVGAFFILAQIAGSFSDYLLTYWVNLEEGLENLFQLELDQFIYVYSSIISGTVLFTVFRVFSFYSYCMRASVQLHNQMFQRVVSATMRFFDANNSGRILNRFSKDLGSIDEYLPFVLGDCFEILLMFLGVSVLVAVANPWLLIPTFVLAFLFYPLRYVYLKTSKNIKHLEGITKSPVFSHFSATIDGLTTIRALGVEKILKKEFDEYQNIHNSAWFIYLSSSRAFSFWLDIICVIYVAVITISFLIIKTDNFGGNVGLAITQSIGIMGIFQWGMRQWAELENQLIAVDRIVEYTETEQEPDNKTKVPISDSWPKFGKIEFRNLYLKYSNEDPHALKNVCFVVEPKQKIGIVGRTGAGKSSLTYVLFKFANFEGSILIDDMDTNLLNLAHLRSKISIIPQEPVVFSGNVRDNLDPLNEYSDEKLWKALEEVRLKQHISTIPGELNCKISDFSVGQRQLICLARAILRNNRILILDEATANVDPQTDSFIQETIRHKFADCTVITIAHRLHTVVDCDKILVMEEGSVVEYGSPAELFKNENGIFHGLAREVGIIKI